MRVNRGRRRPTGRVKCGLGDDVDPARGGQAGIIRLASSGNIFRRRGDRRKVRFQNFRSL